MEKLHISNGKKLEEIIDTYGWPGEAEGVEITNAAWLIAMHAISLPSLQRKVLALLKNNPEKNLSSEVAMLEDRILVFSGKKQLYGTQMDWDELGKISPYPIANPEHVDERRKMVGLEPLSNAIENLRQRATRENEQPPNNLAERTNKREEWMLKVGWISSKDEIDSAYNKYRESNLSA